MARTFFGMMFERRIFHSYQSPGDMVVLTAAIRDLMATYPGEYQIDTRTACQAIFEHNPNITPIPDGEGTHTQLHYPSIHGCNQRPGHFIEAFRKYIAEDVIGRPITQGAFKGDIHLSHEETSWKSIVEQKYGKARPFWIIVSGGKSDYTCKIWHPARWQAVVDHFKDRILFVQVGESSHTHTALKNVFDLRGQTDLRQLIRLVYHSAGVACGVTALMHLAAAVPVKEGAPPLRPCVVVAGAREPQHWECYPGHRFLENVGTLPCCASGACWKSRIVKLGDGEPHDHLLCKLPVTDQGGVTIPKCLDMIRAEDVIYAIESYYACGDGMNRA